MKKKLTILIVVIIVVALGAFTCGNFMLGKIKTKKISGDNASLGINENIDKVKDGNVINILLLGIDGSYERSDAIMVVSIDKTSKQIKMASLLRDMYIDLPGYGNGLLNHAYLKGGPELAIKAVNKNFDMNIKDYVLIQMDGFVKLIDSVGGVNIDVKPEEVVYINSGSKKKIKGAGLQKLNGEQAMAYSRIRKLGTDFARTNREKTILNGIYSGVKSQGLVKLPGTINKLLPFVETSMPKGDILNLATTAFDFNINKIEQITIPVEGYYKFDKVDTWHILNIDLEANKKALNEFIYDKKEQ